MRAGWRPLSFVYTDNDGVKQYVEMGRADPVSTLIGLTADAYYLAPYLEEGDYSEIMMGLAASFTQNIANKAYLSGLAGAMEAFNSPDRQFERFFGNLVGGFAPAGARPISAAVGLDPDPYIREVRGILDRLKSQIPGWSTTLPAQRDWLTGNPRQYPEGYLWGDRSLAPFPRTSRSENDVVNELARIPHGFRGPPRQIQGVDLSPQQHDRWEELHGTIEIGGLTLLERLDQEIRTEDYDLDRNVYPDVGGDASEQPPCGYPVPVDRSLPRRGRIPPP